MSYKNEMAKMIEHRTRYFPVMSMLLGMYQKKQHNDPPLTINDTSDISIILELIDIGYVDRESFIIRRNLRDITGLYYKGGLPLTGEGRDALERENPPDQKRV